VRLLFSTLRPHPRSTLFPYTTLFRSCRAAGGRERATASSAECSRHGHAAVGGRRSALRAHQCVQSSSRFQQGQLERHPPGHARRSEEHTSELQSRENLVCRLLLEKKK